MSDNTKMEQVTISNILATSPENLAVWIATDLLNVRLPEGGSNYTVDMNELVRLLPVISNKMALGASLYAYLAGAKPQWTIQKKSDANMKVIAESAITMLTANIDMMYRALQTLESMRESVRGMMSGIYGLNKMNGASQEVPHGQPVTNMMFR